MKHFRATRDFPGKRKLLKNPEWQKYFNIVEDIRATRVLQGKRKLFTNLEWWKIYIQYSEFNASPAFRASASCSNILNDKKISIQWNISEQLVFFRASASCSKILNDKKFIFNSVDSGQTLFSAQAQVAQKSWMVKNVFNTVENFTANSVFQGKVKKISIQRIQPVNAITLRFLLWENTTRKKLHPLELTSKITTEFVHNGTSRVLCSIKNFIAVLSYKWIEMHAEQGFRNRGACAPSGIFAYLKEYIEG